MTSSNTKLTLFGTTVSQPTRAVYWLLLISGVPFEQQDVMPLRGETKTAEFRKLNPAGLIPVLVEEGEGGKDRFALGESGAILTYLGDKYGSLPQLAGFYPPPSDPRGRARVAAALHHHHGTTRLLTLQVFRPLLLEMAFGKPRDEAAKKRGAKTLESVLAGLEEALQRAAGGFVLGERPTLVDLQYYCEVDQLEVFSIADFSRFPLVGAWAKRMKTLPLYQESHQALFDFAKSIKAKI